MENYKPRSGKKAFKKKVESKPPVSKPDEAASVEPRAVAPAPKPAVSKQSHTFLPDTYAFGQGVKECWASRQNIMGNRIVNLHVLATVDKSELTKDWQDLVEMFRSKGYGVEYSISGGETHMLRPHQGKQLPLPFELVYTDS